MRQLRLSRRMVRFSFVGIVAVIMAATGAWAGEFPYDRELQLQAPPMPPGKRMPVINFAVNGATRIDLWCRTVAARVEIADATIKIEPEPLPENPPAMQSAGQCSQARFEADATFVAALTQVTAWQIERGDLVLIGPERLRFRGSSN